MNCNILHYKGASFQLTSLLNVEIIEIKSAPTVRKYARMVLKDEVKNRNKLKQLENDSTKTVPTSKHTFKNPVNADNEQKKQKDTLFTSPSEKPKVAPALHLAA